MHTKWKNRMERWQANPLKMLLRCYVLGLVLALVFHLGAGLVSLLAYQTGYYEEKHLSIDDFMLVGLERVDDVTLITETDDAQLLYPGNVRSLRFTCEFLQNPGEFISFYGTVRRPAFSPGRMLYAQQRDDTYLFTYPPLTNTVRVDLGVVPSVTVRITDILLNEKTPRQMLHLSTGELFWLFVLPLAGFLLVDTSIGLWMARKHKQK